MNDAPLSYIVRVPEQFRIEGLDKDRWMLVTPAHDGNELEGVPLTEKEAGELYADDVFGMGRPWMADVRRDLLELEHRFSRELPITEAA